MVAVLLTLFVAGTAVAALALVVRTVRWMVDGPAEPPRPGAEASRGAAPYGALPGLGPVGPLGQLPPDADINRPGPDPDDLSRS